MPRAMPTKPGRNENSAMEPAPVANAAPVAAANGGCRSSARSSIALALRAWTTTNPASSTAASDEEQHHSGLPQPCRPSTRAARKALIPVASSTAPGTSTPRRTDRDSSTSSGGQAEDDRERREHE